MLETVYVKHVMRGCIYYTAVVSKKVRQQYIYIRIRLNQDSIEKETISLVLVLVVSTGF